MSAQQKWTEEYMKIACGFLKKGRRRMNATFGLQVYEISFKENLHLESSALQLGRENWRKDLKKSDCGKF